MEADAGGRVQPDLIVGIDFGMTCTGVSYAIPSMGSNVVKWIQKWPGRAQANENKVPTMLVYPSNQNQPKPSSWGFLSETAIGQHTDDKDVRDWFKTFLNPVSLEQQQKKSPDDAPKSMEEVEKWYEDYLRLLYHHVENKLSPELPRMSWDGARVEFIFSVPSTWKPMTVEKFRSIASRAGFGKASDHLLAIGLTEAEAAAVHVSIEASGIFSEGDVLLICDAGGGTTDLTVLEVTDTHRDMLSLKQLDVIFGATIGSASIDRDFEKLVKERLEQADRTTKLNLSCGDVAWEMMKSRDFQNAKCECGGPDETPAFFVPIPKISAEYVNDEVRIENGQMQFTRDDLERLFTTQTKGLINLIDKQLKIMLKIHSKKQVAHLVLSGGLGHSPYVQASLKSHYNLGGSHSNARGMQIRPAPDPQLAVCKGIVADRVYKLTAGSSILKSRCCRASYGTLCRELYDKHNRHHIGRSTTTDEVTQKLYVTQSVTWFIKKGEPVSSNPISHDFTRTVLREDSEMIFPTSIVVSTTDSQMLHPYMGEDTTILCNIESDLSSVDANLFKKKNKHIWNVGKRYFQVEYQIKVLVGPADIRFELFFNGQKINKDRPIKVEWQAAPAP